MISFNKFIELQSNAILIFQRGSDVYGTADEQSDMDFIIVVPDSFELESEIIEYTLDNDVKSDFQIMNEWKWIELINNHDIVAIEGLYLPDSKVIVGYMNFYRKLFHLNPWKLRQSLSRVSSNSWVKCRKKLTIEKDYNLRVAQKSLFHSLRILMFGIQLLETGNIDFGCANNILEEIKSVPYPTWGKYYVRFHDLHNSLQSQFRKLAPKPNV